MRDLDIRAELKRTILACHEGDPTTVVVDELGVLQGSARVDVAVVNGQLHGYEIKSARDTLARLPGQVVAYSQVFDRVTLVLSGSHAERALELVPPWWELFLAAEDAGGVALKPARPGGTNPGVEARAVAELLWADETLELLAARGGARGLRGKRRSLLWDRLCELYTAVEIGVIVRERLKERKRVEQRDQMEERGKIKELQPPARV